MKSDPNIKRQIEKALATPLLCDCKITVGVINSTVTLSGYVDKYFKKEVAKKIAQEVEGIKLVIEELSVVLNGNEKQSDAEIVSAIEQKFSKNFGFAHKDINIVVKDGYVWLEGRLHWRYQRDLAVECISSIDGIKGISNNIFIPETAHSSVSEKDILAAIYSDYSITEDIKVEVFGQKIILKGFIKNSNQKNLVTRLVRTVPGVKEVENFLTVNED